MSQRQDLILQCIVDYSATWIISLENWSIGTVYKAAGTVNFQASRPKISVQRFTKDHDLPSSDLSRITTAVQTKSFRISLRRTAVEVKYRAPLTTGMIRE